MRTPWIALVVISAFVHASSARAARTYSASDFQGGYSFTIEASYLSTSSVGVIVADGTGNVTGHRIANHFSGALTPPTQGMVVVTGGFQPVEQDCTGTYSVDAFGNATLSLTWTPPLASIPWNEGTARPGCNRMQQDPTETWWLALADTGAAFMAQPSATYKQRCPDAVDYPTQLTPSFGLMLKQDAPCGGTTPAATTTSRRVR